MEGDANTKLLDSNVDELVKKLNITNANQLHLSSMTGLVIQCLLILKSNDLEEEDKKTIITTSLKKIVRDLETKNKIPSVSVSQLIEYIDECVKPLIEQILWISDQQIKFKPTPSCCCFPC